MPVVDCVVAATGGKSNQVPKMLFFSVTCTQEQLDEEQDEGVIAEAVENEACEMDCDYPMVVFQRQNGPSWLFEHFIAPRTLDISNNY